MINMRNLTQMEIDEEANLVLADAGVLWSSLINFTARHDMYPFVTPKYVGLTIGN